MNVLLVQPFGLNSPGGGARILRSLCTNAPARIVSACVAHHAPPHTRVVEEVHLPTRPRLSRLRSSRLGPVVRQLDDVGHRGIESKLESLIRKHEIDAVHALADAHVSFALAHRIARKAGIRFTLSVHDAPWYKRLPIQAGNRRFYAALGDAWRDADARTVISEEMGETFSDKFGRRPYTAVTDGLDTVCETSTVTVPHDFAIYFAGSVHLAHREVFGVLVEAIRHIRESGAWRPRLVLRGSTIAEARRNDFIEVRNWATDAEVGAETASADILYLPLPFGERYAAFTDLSLPTKLVTYLGSGRPILYHGPEGAATARLLRDAGAALLVVSEDPGRVADELTTWLGSEGPARSAANALELARARFLRIRLRSLFWSAVLGTPAPAEAAK